MSRSHAALEVTTSVERSITAFDVEEWDGLTTREGFYLSHAWLSTLEGDETYQNWYITARDRVGALLGVLPAHVWLGAGRTGGVAKQYDAYQLFAAPLGSDDEPGAWLPALLLGARAAYNADLLLRDDLPPDDRAGVLTAMWAEVEALATAVEAKWIGALYLTTAATAALVPFFADTADPLLTDANACVPLDGFSSFVDYLESLSRNRRATVKREIAKFAKGGYDVSTRPLSACVEVGGRLLAAHHRSHGHDEQDEEMIAYLARQVEHLDRSSRVLVCSQSGRDLGFSLSYEWKDRLYGRASGFVEDARARDAIIFNVNYYLNLAHAIESGLCAYDLGVGSYPTKVLRGARLDPRWSLVRVPHRSRPLKGRLAAKWNDDKRAKWRNDFGRFIQDDPISLFLDPWN